MKRNQMQLALGLLLCLATVQTASSFYNPSTGRWLSRDPIEETGGRNLYALVANSTVKAVDVLGLWNSDIHHDATRRWALHARYPEIAAEKVARADDDVDSKYSYIFEPGTQYHFNRSLSMRTSEDTRMIKYNAHLRKAQTFCTKAKGHDDPETAAVELGTALHPYQDWVAHGDHNYYLLGSFHLDLRYRHNWMSPKTGSYAFPDDPTLDAEGEGAVDGRANLSVLHLVIQSGKTFDFADYVPGRKRYRLTHSMTSSSLTGFQEFVRAYGGCKCRIYFGIQ